MMAESEIEICTYFVAGLGKNILIAKYNIATVLQYTYYNNIFIIAPSPQHYTIAIYIYIGRQKPKAQEIYCNIYFPQPCLVVVVVVVGSCLQLQ